MEWDFESYSAPHYTAPIEFQLDESDDVILDFPFHCEGGIHRGHEVDSRYFDLKDGTTLFDIKRVECWDKEFVSKNDIPLHDVNGDDFDPDSGEPCFVCQGIAEIVLKARKLQYVPPTLVYHDKYVLDEWSKERRDESYNAYLDVFLSQLFPNAEDLKGEVKRFLSPTINLVRLQYNLLM